MEFIFEIIFQFLFELGFHALAEPFRKTPSPWLAAFGYVLLGANLGAVTLWFFPFYPVKFPALRWVNLALTPVVVGACMPLMGSWRENRAQRRLGPIHMGAVRAKTRRKLAMSTHRIAGMQRQPFHRGDAQEIAPFGHLACLTLRLLFAARPTRPHACQI